MPGLYPRTISISRPNAVGGVGAQPYSSLQSAGETTVCKDKPASIQLSRRAGSPDPALPSDAVSAMGYTIYVPSTALQLGQVLENDTVTDDLGDRYQVVGPYWNLLGYALSVTKLKE